MIVIAIETAERGFVIHLLIIWVKHVSSNYYDYYCLVRALWYNTPLLLYGMIL